LALSVRDGGFHLHLPLRTDIESVRHFVMSQRSWLKRQQQKLKLEAERFRAFLRWEPPAQGLIFLRGQAHEIVFDAAPGQVIVEPRRIRIGPGRRESQRRLLANTASRLLGETLSSAWNYFFAQHQVRPRKVLIKPMRSLWGSCSSNGNMRLNTALAFAPPACARAVLAHELAHLDHRNHSQAFWARLRELEPSYEEHDAWLTAQQEMCMRLNQWLFQKTTEED
jgi:hypothetical protein